MQIMEILSSSYHSILFELLQVITSRSVCAANQLSDFRRTYRCLLLDDLEYLRTEARHGLGL